MHAKPPSIPAKRDSTGEEKDRAMLASAKSPVFQPVVAEEHASPSQVSHPHPEEDAVPSIKQEPSLAEVERGSPSPSNAMRGSTRVDVDMVMADPPTQEAAPGALELDVTPEATEHLSEEDDGMDLDEDYMAANEARFARELERLESRKINLEAPWLRSATALEALARLAALTFDDLLCSQSQGSSLIGEISHPAKARRSDGIGMLGLDGGAVKLLTPKTERQDGDVIMMESIIPEELIDRPLTPEASSLIFLTKGPPTPLSELEAFQEREYAQRELDADVSALLLQQRRTADDLQEDIKIVFRENYMEWRIFTLELDKELEEREKMRRQNSAEPALTHTTPDPAPLPTPGPVTEGRRAHKFNSEYELELAIKESMELEQKAQAEREREEKKAKADFEREAEIPEMYQDLEIRARLFIDTNQLRQPVQGARVFDFQPPKDDFTPEEHKVLVQNYREFPKKWGKIAQALPNRTYKECINHYYATKWDKEYKPPKDRRRQKGAKGRAGKGAGQSRGKSNALMSDLGVRPEVYEGDEFSLPLVAITDSGRPRRAAAPVFGDKESESEQNAPAPTPGRKPAPTSRPDPSAEPTTEKQVKRPRAGTKSQGQKKSKNPPLAAAPAAAAPQKAEKERPGTAESKIENAPGPRSVEDAKLLTALQAVPKPALVERPQAFREETVVVATQPGPMSVMVEKPKAQGQQQQRAGASSYWSVPEQNDVIKLIAYYGKDWTAIANQMGTKTPTMVSRRLPSVLTYVFYSGSP